MFGSVTSAMAGLYLIGFAAPAFEAAGCHVGETIDPNRNVPRAFYASAAMAVLFFVAAPVVWLGVIGAVRARGRPRRDARARRSPRCSAVPPAGRRSG